MEARTLTTSIHATISPKDAAGEYWDAIVIGAGPAGSVAAAGLARADLRTLLLDRVPPPRPKVCGCCLSAHGADMLQRLGLGEALESAIPLRTLRLHAGRRSANIAMNGARCISREALDARLASLANRAGSELLWPASARAIPDGTARIECRDATITARAAAIIVADGLGGSSLRGTSKTAWHVRPGSRIGAGAMLEDSPVPLRDGEVVMICEPEGYVGLVRLPDDRIDVAAAFDATAMRAAGGPANIAALLIARVGGDAGAVLKGSWRGTATLTRRRERAELGRILVVGDAAGYVEPFTGEGMTWAIQTGEAVVEHAAEIVRGSYTDGAWTRAKQRLLAKRHRTCSLIAHVLRSPRAINLAVRLAAAHPSLASIVAHRFVSPQRGCVRGLA